jgi:hypothetical protein
MKIYKIATEETINEPFLMDDVTAMLLHKWLQKTIPLEEYDDALNKILAWMSKTPKEDVEFALEKGWWRVYNLAME